MKKGWLAAALLAGCIAMTAQAFALPLENEDLDRPRFYLGIDALVGIEDLKVGNQPVGGSFVNVDITDQNWGGGMRAGYRFHPHLAAELQGQYNGLYEVRGNTVGRPNLGSVEIITSTANLKAYALRGPIQPYALGGVGIMWADTEDRVAGTRLPLGEVDFAGRGGLGVDFYLSPMLAVNLEGSYVAGTGGLSGYGIAALGAGVQWHF
jgi:opacity protein-like surface antigen